MARRASAAKRREWSERLERFEVSGQTVAKFCEAEGVSTASLYQWRRRLSQQEGGGLQCVETRDAPNGASRFLPVRVALEAPPVLTVRLPNGIAIEVNRDQFIGEVVDRVVSSCQGVSPC